MTTACRDAEFRLEKLEEGFCPLLCVFRSRVPQRHLLGQVTSLRLTGRKVWRTTCSLTAGSNVPPMAR